MAGQMLEQAAVVPLIIGITQAVKPFKRFYKLHGVIAFAIAIVGTLCISIYNLDKEAFYALGTYEIVRMGINCLFTAAATWLSASKLYDLAKGRIEKNGKHKNVEKPRSDGKDFDTFGEG